MKIAFISTKNAVRSIMAEAVARKLSRLALLTPEIYSAGVEPAQEVSEKVIALLKGKGYPTENLRPKGVDSIPYDQVDVLITLSPEARDRCPYSERHMRREHWVLEEPSSMKREELSRLLEQIENLVRNLFRIS